ncbi:MAG: hypothetical protein RQ756_00270 [Flavobacteriaceae bacterium]|nr:hypothetical protein [Flavobacteriaceae bacterium]
MSKEHIIKDQIPLRIRFKESVDVACEDLKAKVDKLIDQKSQKFEVRRLEEHVWIYIKAPYKKYYSPNLHLELEAADDGSTLIHGVYGPNPGLWTMFMFLHFVVAGVFIMFAAFAYSNWALGHSLVLDIVVMLLMLVCWFVLYFSARFNRKKGLPQARAIEDFYNSIHTTSGSPLQ